MNKIAKALGAKRRGKVAASVGAMQLLAEVKAPSECRRAAISEPPQGR